MTAMLGVPNVSSNDVPGTDLQKDKGDQNGKLGCKRFI